MLIPDAVSRRELYPHHAVIGYTSSLFATERNYRQPRLALMCATGSVIACPLRDRAGGSPNSGRDGMMAGVIMAFPHRATIQTKEKEYAFRAKIPLDQFRGGPVDRAMAAGFRAASRAGICGRFNVQWRSLRIDNQR